MDTLILDPHQSQRLVAERHARGLDRFDEVWEGVYIMAPAPNDEHQQVTTRLSRPFLEILEDAGIAKCELALTSPGDPTIIESDVLPLHFRLVTGAPQPTIEVVTGDSDRSWTI